MFLTLLLAGCRTKYVTVPEYRYQDSVEVRYRRDSVYLHDSVYVSERHTGDTVYLAKYRERTLYRDKLRTDTVYVERTDSIYVPYCMEKEKHTLYWWQEMLMWMGAATVVYLIIRKTL
ncbi:MAG: hypothetical protein K2H16_06110 [Prevotella sp.]|nr:hypothetical protein [Prevotella sp.]MDE6152221.1 hypothetical protein [Prevotella sp.]